METQQIAVEHQRNYFRDNREKGRDCLSDYAVTRPGKTTHIVTVRCSFDGTPQDEWCDCWAYKTKKTCPHITAVYEARELYSDWS